jgi:hypothetical protein
MCSKQRIDGAPACRRQFPIQNAFALTVHKTQGLTLPSVRLELDETIFAYGQAYIAISRAKRWEDIAISSFCLDSFRDDRNVTAEYNRLRTRVTFTDGQIDARIRIRTHFRPRTRAKPNLSRGLLFT